MRSDVAKIAGTNRGYAKAFFVSNQAISDRKRAELEDALRAEHGLEVRILDRTWILDRVFKGRHEQLAISELKVTALSRREIKKGPLDVRREVELEEVERRLREALHNERFGIALVDDALNAASLARSLERPRAEIEGRFARAYQLADKYGGRRQKVEASYQWAWTLFWWLEDYNAFVDQYGVVERHSKGSRNAYDLERLATLWYALKGAIVRGVIDEQFALYDVRTASLIKELERLRTEKDRPSTSLNAEALLLEVDLLRGLAENLPVDDVLRSLQGVVLRSKGLVGYPLEPLVEMLSEVGPVLEVLSGDFLCS